MNIPTGELFRDLQISYTEVVLLNMLSERGYLTGNDRRRLQGNMEIIDNIKQIMEHRFTVEDIQQFLENGYPRATSLDSIIMQDM